MTLDSGCNGVIFIQMRKQDGDPGPRDIVQHIMQSAASTRKHMSRSLCLLAFGWIPSTLWIVEMLFYHNHTESTADVRSKIFIGSF